MSLADPPGRGISRRALLSSGGALAAGVMLGARPAMGRAADGGSGSSLPPRLRPWNRTVAPFEHADSARTHLFAAPSLLERGAGRDWRVEGRIVHEELLPTPFNVITGRRRELYVYGGAYGGLPGNAGPYIARLDAASLEIHWKRPLSNALAEGRWNYPGGIGLTRGGSLLAVYGNRLARIDRRTGRVLREVVLPSVGEPRDTVYNGFTLLSDGTLVTKSINRGRTDVDGFGALLDPTPREIAPTIVLALDPGPLRIKAAHELPEPCFGRLTAMRHRGRDEVVLPGTERIFRLRAGERLVPVAGWEVPYLRPGQTSGSACAAFGGMIAVQTNGTPARVPMSVLCIPLDDPDRRSELQPFADLGTSSFLPSMLSADPANRRIYAADNGPGAIACLDVGGSAERPALRSRWRADQSTLSWTALVGSRRRRALTATEIGPYGERLVWRAARTGRRLADGPWLEPMTAGSIAAPGFGGHFFYPIQAGGLARLRPRAA